MLNIDLNVKHNPTGLRVTHILYSGLGGHSAVLFALIEGGFMRDAQHSVLFVGVETPPAEYFLRCKKLRIDCHYLPKLSASGHLKFLLTLTRQCASSNPDVLFLHGLAAMPSVALLKLFRRGRQPFVLVRETQANHLKSRREWLSLALAHRYADRIVHLTEEAADGAALHLKRFIRLEKVTVVPNGLDTNFYKPTAIWPNNDGVVNIGMQSRLQSNKDHATLIAAFLLVCQRHPDKRFHLHIAGDGSTYPAIAQMIRVRNLNAITTMHGMLDQIGIRDLLRKLDFYVHCTHGETMSTAIMQALSCGLPVIASNVKGVANMVRPEAGLLYMPGDAVDLANRVDELLNNPDEAQKWRLRARIYALKHYAIATTICKYQSLLMHLDSKILAPKDVKTTSPETDDYGDPVSREMHQAPDQQIK
jgi:glycosyltransferase involved in cell wall biosynthesis